MGKVRKLCWRDTRVGRNGQALAVHARYLCKIWWDGESPQPLPRRPGLEPGPITPSGSWRNKPSDKEAVPGDTAYGSRLAFAALTWPGRRPPLLPKPVRPAFLDAALERGPGVHPRQPGTEVRVASELVECFRHVADKAHLDVGAGQRIADKEFATAERAIDIAEVGHLAVDARMQGRARLLQPGDIEVEQQRQHRRTFRIMQPLVIGLVVGASRRRHHAGFTVSLAVAADEVIDDGAGLREPDVAIGDNRRLAERMHRLQLRWRKPWLRAALIALHLIGYPQFFQQPQNPLRAGVIEMMQGEHGCFLGASR